jgi:hypothetical protein
MIFIVSFLLIVIFPALFTDTESGYSKDENRMLATFPNPFLDNAENIFRQTDNYINDRIGFKKHFVRLNTTINLSILRGKRNNDVLIGKNDWLFYISKLEGNNLLDFQKQNLFDDSAMRNFIEQINERVTWCEEHGIQFIFLVPPNKHNVYPEYYPMERPAGPTRTDQIMNNLPAEILDKTIFLRDYLLSRKSGDSDLLYYETDTHWNGLGAYYAYEAILEKLREYFPRTEFPDIKFTKTVFERPGGDLVPMLGLASFGKTTEVQVEPEKGWPAYYTYKDNTETDRFVTGNINKDLPKAVIFRDSFFVALAPFTSSIFSQAEYIWKSFEEEDTRHILEAMPDIVIWETGERRLGNIPQWK